MRSQELPPHVCGQLICNKDANRSAPQKGVSFRHVALGQLDIQMQTNESAPHTALKSSPKMGTYLHIIYLIQTLRSHRELSKVNMKTDTQTKKRAKGLNSHFTKEVVC